MGFKDAAVKPFGRWFLVIVVGVLMFTLGAGMRGIAQTEQRDLIARLLNARPSQPNALKSPEPSWSLPQSAGVPIRIKAPALGLWNALMPVYTDPAGLVWRTGDAVWHVPSGTPGAGQNVVIAGHSPSRDPQTWGHSIFRGLPRLVRGDRITLEAGSRTIMYAVALTFAIPAEQADSPEASAWIAPTGDERLTLITCYPPHTADYRVITVAFPVAVQESETYPEDWEK